MNRTITVAAIAVATLDGMPQSNYARALRLGELALAYRPDIILFPEAFAAGYCGTDLSPYVETLDGSAYLQAFQQLSGAGQCLVAVGHLAPGATKVRNVVSLFLDGQVLGVHGKSSLWPDDERPYRDERALMERGEGMTVFDCRLGRFAVLICYENMLEENWRAIQGADFVLSPYNCEGDPSHNNTKYAKLLALPSAWADRTGTVYCPDAYMPNLGTAGMVDMNGEVVAMSAPGVEEIVVGRLMLKSR